MEEYIVSARKYRPASFDTVVGQHALTTTLKNAIASEKLAHAYLFCGPRGVGKTTCARIFAKAINCLNPTSDGEACGECESCRAFDEQRSMNIHELDAASNNSVEDIRELCKQVLIPPQIGRYKVFIIDEVHMLSSAAFNAFLKTLEEPPSYVVFILATTEKHKILPTILSRCQVYDFARMTIQNTVDHLAYVAQKEGYTAEPEALNLIAQKADGGMRDALSIFDQMVSFCNGDLTYERVCENLNVLSAEYYFRLVELFMTNDVRQCLMLLNEVLNKGFDGGNFIDGLARHLRDLLVSQDACTLPLLEVSGQMRNRFQEQAQQCPARFLYKGIKLCNDCNQAYRTSRNKRLQLELCLIQVCQLTEPEAQVAEKAPVQTLKPAFQQPVTQAATAATATVQNVQADRNVQTVRDVQMVQVSQAPQPKAETTPAPESATPRIQWNQESKKKGLPTIDLSKLGHKGMQKKEEEKKEDTPVAPPVETISHILPLSEETFPKVWFQYINSLPLADEALAQRMKDMRLVQKDADTLTLTVNGPQVKEMLNERLAHIVGFMAQHLQHPNLRIEINVADMVQAQKRFSKPELLREMTAKNPAIGKFVQDLTLSIE